MAVTQVLPAQSDDIGMHVSTGSGWPLGRHRTGRNCSSVEGGSWKPRCHVIVCCSNPKMCAEASASQWRAEGAIAALLRRFAPPTLKAEASLQFCAFCAPHHCRNQLKRRGRLSPLNGAGRGADLAAAALALLAGPAPAMSAKDSCTDDGEDLRALAVWAAQALVGSGGGGGRHGPPSTAQLRRLFPPSCCYLSLAVSRQPLGSAAAGSSLGAELLLLSPNLLTAGSTAKAGVHPLRSCFAGNAILAGQPRMCSTHDVPQRLSSDAVAAAAQGALSLLCLPFRLALVAADSKAAGQASTSSTSGSPGSLSGALLLGSPAAGHSGAGEQAAAPRATAAMPSLQAHLKALMRVAAAIALHARHELAAAAEALALLDSQFYAPLPPPPWEVAGADGANCARSTDSTDDSSAGSTEECDPAYEALQPPAAAETPAVAPGKPLQ